MESYQWMAMGLQATWLVFFFALGSCCGSLINVLVYRLPLGMGVLTPPSRCPACGTKLSMGRDNIPVIGWVLIGGRCRFCKSKISAEYPLVELLVGLLFAGFFALYYMMPDHAVWLGVDWSAVRPEWAMPDRWDGWPRTTWPMFAVVLILVASLVAMTLVDAKTFTIPLVLPWVLMGAGVVLHTGGALIHQYNPAVMGKAAMGWAWAIPTPGGSSPMRGQAWWWIGASLGGIGGLVVANLLLRFGLIRRSFEDYPEWERIALGGGAGAADCPLELEVHATETDSGAALVDERAGEGVRLVVRFTLVWLASIMALGAAGAFAGPGLGVPEWGGLAAGALLGPLLAALACRSIGPGPRSERAVERDEAVGATLAGESENDARPAEMWIQYPHARREMLKELVFLTPVIALGWLGGWIGVKWSGQVPPFWLLVLCGSLMGILIGGGAIWAIRIGGSLAFGKEAMGLGDVHLMAAVGACLGWVDPVLAIPLAAVVGLYGFLIAMLANRPSGRAMPFGPYLAIGTLLVVLGKPLIEMGLNELLGTGDGVLPINLP